MRGQQPREITFIKFQQRFLHQNFDFDARSFTMHYGASALQDLRFTKIYRIVYKIHTIVCMILWLVVIPIKVKYKVHTYISNAHSIIPHSWKL